MSGDSRAVLTRPVPAPDATVAYGGDPAQVADVRRPVGAGGARRLVVVVHGGFWRTEYDRAHTGPLAVALAALGHPVAQLEYRRTGQGGGGWPGTLTDVLAGVAALPSLAAEALPGLVALGPPVVVGHSAGGQLALHVAAYAPQTVAGVLALAPVADLVEAYRQNLDDGAVAAFLGGGPEEVPDRYALADPLTSVPLHTRTVVVHGVRDRQVPVALSRAFVAAARAAGASASLIELPDSGHFGLIDPLSPAWPHVVDAWRSLLQDL